MNNLLEKSKLFWKRNGTTVLTYAGAAGVVVTTILAVKATPKAVRLLEQAEKEKGEELTVIEKVKVAGPTYIPTALAGISTISCIFGLNVIHKNKQAGLISAYTLLDQSFKEYKAKNVELYGEEADLKIKEAVANDKYDEQKVEEENDGTQLFYDNYSNRFFRATNETVLSAEYAINKMLCEDCYASLNDLYDLFEIPEVDYGQHVGWDASRMFETYWSSWIEFYHHKATTDDGTEYYIIDYSEPMVDDESYYA